MVWGLLLLAWALGFALLWALVYVGARSERWEELEPVRVKSSPRRPRWTRPSPR